MFVCVYTLPFYRCVSCVAEVSNAFFFVRALCDGAWQDYAVPIDPKLQAGKLATRFWRTLLDIQYGVVESPWSVVVG